MAREQQSTVNPVLRDLFSLELYKRSQGRMVRQATFAALAAVVVLGAYRLSLFISNDSPTLRFVAPALVSVVGLWISYRVVNWPRFADFLIAVEAEVNKVSWPSRSELVRSTIVVLITIFAMAALLYVYDFTWRVLLRALGVVK